MIRVTLSQGGNNMSYTIKQASKILEVSAHTLRYYEKEGIVQNIKRLENGNRVYSLKDLQWIYLIVCLRETGMPLEEIKLYILYTKNGKETIPQRYEMIKRQKQEALHMINNLNKKLNILEDKLSFYEALIHDKNAPDEWNPAISIPKAGLQKLIDKHKQ